MRIIHLVLGTVAVLAATLRGAGPRPRDERGLSQSTENAILLAGTASR